MHFQSIALNIVLPNTYVQNYLNKNSIISYFGLSLFPPLSPDAQSYTKFLQLKSTNENAQNLRLFLTAFARCKAYNFVVLLQKLDCCILQSLERESRFPFSKK